MRFPKLSALALAATLASPAFASAVFDGFVSSRIGTTTTFYDTDLATNNANWIDGLANLVQGSNLWLGGQVKSWPGLTEPVGPNKLGANDSFDTMVMKYSIDGHTALNLTLLRIGAANSSTNDLWQNSGSGVDVASGLAIGNHTINVSFEGKDIDGRNGTSLLDNRALGANSGPGWTANFDVVAAPVPEPTSGALILAGLGMLGFMTKRRRAVG